MYVIAHDVRYALRALRRSPAFTTVAVLTIALGIGANTAIFSLVNAALLQPLGYPQAQQLMFLTTRFSDGKPGSFSAAEFWELAGINQSFSLVSAFVTGEVNLSTRERPRRVMRASVTAELFEALAVPPERGRWFRRDETRDGGPALVILSHRLWQSAFGARNDLVGQSIEIDGVSSEVIGIMPAGFDLMDKHVELWTPLQLAASIRQFRASHFLSVVGRLKNGVTQREAEAELASLTTNWGERLGVSGHVFTSAEHPIQMKPLLDEVVGAARLAFWLLQAGVGLVLLIACANLANLLMARAEARSREITIRTALGAGHLRLLTQFIAEGLVLLVPGGALGLVIAWGGVRALTIAYPESVPRVADVGIDPAVLGFTLIISALTGLVFCLAPLRNTRPRVRGALVSGEVALAMVLVAGAGLMVRTVLNLLKINAGFEQSRLVTFAVAPPPATYPTFDQRVQLYNRLFDRFSAMPGVENVAAVSGLPPQRDRNLFGTEIEDYTPPPEKAELVKYYQTVTTGYFEAMRIPIVKGRAFERTDRVSAAVAVVNETFVRTFWNGLDPIGRRVRPRFGDQTPWVTVVGVAADVKQAGVDQPVGTELYLLFEQLPRIFPTIPASRIGTVMGIGSMHIMVRSTLPAAALQSSIADAVRAADPSLPIIRLRNMSDVVRDSVRRPRMLMQLFAAFAGLALLLAAIGTYGVLSYVVEQHRKEIGIRMALGAERALVLRSVIAQGLKLTGIGLAAGLASALLVTRLMKTLLFDVRPNDPATLAGVAALITAVAAAASLVPAVRATRVDPIVALRND